MNRNAAIAVILVGVLLAALSVGVSTFMSNRGLEQTTEDMRAEMGDSAGELESQLAEVSSLAAAALPSANGLANGLTSEGLYAAGKLAVSPSAGDTPVFSVDTAAQSVTSDLSLTVRQKSTLGDVDSGLISATGVVADTFSNGYDGRAVTWKVDTGGNVEQSGDLKVVGNAEIGGNLAVKGTNFNVGPGLVYAQKFSWTESKWASELASLSAKPVRTPEQERRLASLKDLKSKVDGVSALVVRDGYVLAKGFLSTAEEGTRFIDDVIFNQNIKQAEDKWSITKYGEATFSNLVTTPKLNGSTSMWWVTDTGEGHFNKVVSGTLTSGSADITGEMHAASASIDGTLTVGGQQIGPGGVNASDKTVTARHFIAKQSFSLDNGNFEVDSAGNGDFAGKLTATEFESASTDFRVSSAGAMTVGSATVNGDLDVNGDIYGNFRGTIDDTTTWNKSNLSVSNLTAANSIRLDSGSVVFSVASNGNTSVGGTLAVAGNASVGGNLNVTGDASVAGNITAANLKNMAAGSVIVTAGSSVSQAVAGITAAGGVVVATPADTAVSPYRAWASNGSITIENLSATDATFNWVAMW